MPLKRYWQVQRMIVYTFYGVKKVYYGVGKLGMSFALKSPVSLISDDLLGEMVAQRICKGPTESILRMPAFRLFKLLP